MTAQERFKKISDLLSLRQKMTVHELQTALDISPATLRRDLTEMEAAGRLIRVRGAVLHPAYFRGEPSFAQKKNAAVATKRAIARAAATLVPANSTVLVDAGTTCLELGRLLMARRDLTIITHSLPLATLAHEGADGAKVICIGGEVRAISGAMVGALALAWLEKLRADWCFVGASGLALKDGASTTEIAEAGMKQSLIRRSQQKVLLADLSKWEAPATIDFAGWNEFDYWITDDENSQIPFKEQDSISISAQGVRVVRADAA